MVLLTFIDYETEVNKTNFMRIKKSHIKTVEYA